MSHMRPFDARLQLLTDVSSPEPTWGTVSLVRALKELVRRDPEAVVRKTTDARLLKAMANMADELTRRGLDANSLLRYGLFPELVGGVVSFVLPGLSEPDVPSLSQNRVTGWRNLVEPRLAQAGVALPTRLINLRTDDIGAIVAVAVPVIIPWIMTAPIADLYALTPPPATEPGDLGDLPPIDVELLKEYRWAVDRFSETRLQDWDSASLHLEYRWTMGEHPAPCPPELMADRPVHRDALEQEITRRTVAPVGSGREWPEVHQSLAQRMQRQAVGFLRDGQHREAAALFEFAAAEAPADASAANNLGFCLIPEDPEVARQHLERAAQLGYQPAVINAYNRALCAMLLREPAKSLRIAEEMWNEGCAAEPAYLWKVEGGSLSLAERVDARFELACIAHSAAHELGDHELIELWAGRAAA